MEKPLFTIQQLFQLKRKTLEKRLTNYYQETQDGDTAIQYLLVLQVREELTIEDFSWMMKDLVRKIFLTTKATRIQRRLFSYFKEYFSAREWRKLAVRLTSVKNWLAEKFVHLGTKITGLSTQVTGTQTPAGAVLAGNYVSANQLLESPPDRQITKKTPTDTTRKRRWRLLERLSMLN